jgi:hypothetical protein
MRYYLLLAILSMCGLSVQAQARLTIKNNSQRQMTVKVMQGYGKGTLHETVVIKAYGEVTVRFYSSGTYFTKTKAVLAGKEPIYQKGKSFQVTNDETGYSVLTITYSIKESAVPQVLGGTQISKTEFDQN